MREECSLRRNWILVFLAAFLAMPCACSPAAAEADPRTGRYSGSQIRVSGGSWQPITAVYTAPTYLSLQADGTAILCVDGEAADAQWTETDTSLTLTLGSEQCTGTLTAGVIELQFFTSDITLRFCGPGAQAQTDLLPEDTADTDASSAQHWAGNWYGWHVITDASADLAYLKDTAWDACAELTVNGSAGTLRVWDTETPAGESLCQAALRFSADTAETGSPTIDSGTYLGCTIDSGAASDPDASDMRAFERMLCISGRAEDAAGSWVCFRIYLRPWGMDWEDVRTGDTDGCLYADMLPPGYDGWYLPLLRQNAEMPAAFPSESGQQAE